MIDTVIPVQFTTLHLPSLNIYYVTEEFLNTVLKKNYISNDFALIRHLIRSSYPNKGFEK